jgi:SAM-dependent methyltransferase
MMNINELYDKKVYNNEGNPDVLTLIHETDINILDIGCGAGDNAKILKHSNKYVAGVTISKGEAILLQNICDEVAIADIEAEELVYDRKFDVIILSHVCEHLRDPAAALVKLSKHLAINGIIIVAVPNMAYYKSRLRILKGNWKMEETGPFDRTHLHFYSYDSINSLADKKELQISEKLPGQIALPLWPLRRLLPEMCKKLDNTIGKYFPNLFSQQVILVLKK